MRGGARIVRLPGPGRDLLDLASAARMPLLRLIATDYLLAVQIRGEVNARLLDTMSGVRARHADGERRRCAAH